MKIYMSFFQRSFNPVLNIFFVIIEDKIFGFFITLKAILLIKMLPDIPKKDRLF